MDNIMRFMPLGVSSGFIFGVAFLLGSNFAIEQTSTNEFCFSCHEMEDNLKTVYENSSHFKNASGVQAQCKDCHIPTSLLPKLKRKILAINDVYHGLMGTIDTPGKFAAKHLQMAEKVWSDMEADMSHNCQTCHSYSTMDFDKQSRRAASKMKHAQIDNQPCIQCRKGLVHDLPADYSDDDD